MHCGFIVPAKRLAGLRPFDEAAVCPGYTTRLPEVFEAARALSWTKRGGLGSLYGEGALPPCAVEAIDVLESSANTVERRVLREAREGVNHGPG